MSSGPGGVWQRARRFFGEEIWDVDLGSLPRGRALAYGAARVAVSAGRAILDNKLNFRAAALTYFTVLSIVPFLAFAFAILKGFGAYRSFIDGTVRPYLHATFAANSALVDAIDRILQFVDATDVSKLGTVGVLFLVYTTVSLLSNVEVALNDIFEAKAQRPFLRQLTDYVTMVVIAPLLLVVAAAFAATAQSSSAMTFLRETLALGPVIDFLLRFTSLPIAGVAMFATYMILPNVRTRPTSALLGASVAAVMWQIALVLHVQFQLGVARYNALYSVLGALPIFFVWTYVSWLILLVGAQLAATHQNARAARQRLHAQRADQALKETLAIALAAHVARDFLAGGPRRTSVELAELLEVPLPTVEEILDRLVRAGVLVRAVVGRDVGYVPGRDVDAVRVSDVRAALRRDPQAEEIRSAVERHLEPELQRALATAEEESCASAKNRTLRELAALVKGGPPIARGPAGARSGAAIEVVDAKQPDVPA